MAARVAGRQATTLARILSPRSSAQAANFTQQRGLADHHGPAKINVWQDPMSPSKWKEGHFVIVSLSGWGLFIYGTYKFFTGGKGKKEENLAEVAQ